MDKPEIYRIIKSKADELCGANESFLRADLSYDLRKYGVASDSSEVSKLVFDAYKYYHEDENIAKAFVSNSGRTTLVEEYELIDCLENGDKAKALELAESELGTSSIILDKLSCQIKNNLSLAVAESSSKIMDIVTGTSGVKELRSKASVLFDKYSQMVELYHNAENSVRRNIEDFVSLRSDINAAYREYAMKLIDIYGDSIKMVSPDLFDFSRVQWLNVDDMLKYVELEYNKLSDKCSVLLSEISDSFRDSLKKSLTAYKSTSNSSKSMGLAMAGIEMLNHYLDSNERTNRLKTDFSAFQMTIKHDATSIRADLARLTVIYKKLEENIIPKATIFMRYGEKLMASDLKAISNCLYDNDAVRPYEEKRIDLLRRLKGLNVEINDHLQSIDVYSALINDISSNLESKRASYNEAKSKKPSKPFFLVNIVTLGLAKKNYYRDYSEWNAVCAPLIREYDNCLVDLKLNKEELESHQKSLSETKALYDDLSIQLSKVSSEIRKRIECTDELKMNVLKHLRDIIAMLRLGREIMESKLDESLLDTVNISNFKDTVKLPADVESNLLTFTNVLADNVHADRKMAIKILDGASSICSDTEQDSSGADEYSESEISAVMDSAETSVTKGVALFDSFANLKLQQMKGRIASDEYDRELERYISTFRGYMHDVENKSRYLQEVFRCINIADDDEQKKQAMFLLRELAGSDLSEDDLNGLISGHKQMDL